MRIYIYICMYTCIYVYVYIYIYICYVCIPLYMPWQWSPAPAPICRDHEASHGTTGHYSGCHRPTPGTENVTAATVPPAAPKKGWGGKTKQFMATWWNISCDMHIVMLYIFTYVYIYIYIYTYIHIYIYIYNVSSWLVARVAIVAIFSKLFWNSCIVWRVRFCGKTKLGEPFFWKKTVLAERHFFLKNAVAQSSFCSSLYLSL